MSRGVDITTLDILPASGYDADGFGYNLLSFTCAKHGIHTFNGINYDQPDQIEATYNRSESSIEVEPSLYEKIGKFETTLASQVGIQEYKAGMFSLSSSRTLSLTSMQHQLKFIMFMQSSHSTYEVNFKPS